MITFAILGHNEAAMIGNAVRLAREAAAPGDRVLVVDSGSCDDTAARALRAGAEVITAPRGKGRAMAAAVAAANSPWICFLDADISDATHNYAATLRAAVARTSADHLLGEYENVHAAVHSNTFAVYEPVVSGLVPEAAGRFGTKPLTGFRAVRRERLRPADFPPGFGIEAHLNIAGIFTGVTHQVVPIGPYRGPFRYKPYMGREIAAAVLDLAERYGRLSPGRRPTWDEWVEEAVGVIAGYHGTAAERPAFVEQLERLAARPLPAAR